jgi:MerR family transcriptional regulator, heat shock protein HspR
MTPTRRPDPAGEPPRRADRGVARDAAVYVISVAAELAGVHPQTLRIYERKGLVEPARTGGGSRRYSDDDVAMLRRIQELTTEGLNLAGVKRVLEMESELDRLRAELTRVRRDAEQAVEEAHRQYRRDLVPVSQAVVLYEGRRRGRGTGR